VEEEEEEEEEEEDEIEEDQEEEEEVKKDEKSLWLEDNETMSQLANYDWFADDEESDDEEDSEKENEDEEDYNEDDEDGEEEQEEDDKDEEEDDEDEEEDDEDVEENFVLEGFEKISSWRDFRTYSWMHISVDEMRIRYFPHLGFEPQAHSTYFMLKLKMHTMGIVDEGSGRGVAYVWDNTLGATKTIHVLTTIWSYIMTHGRGEQNLQISLDNCPLNKSYLICAAAVALVSLGFFKQVCLNWLVVGHTKFSPDRMFGTFSKVLKNTDYYSREGFADLLQEKTGSSFSAELLDEVLDFSKIMASHFRTKKFLVVESGKTTSKTIGVQKLQGLCVYRASKKVGKRTISVVRVRGIRRHSLSNADRARIEKHIPAKVMIPDPFDDSLKKVFQDRSELKSVLCGPHLAPVVEMCVFLKGSNESNIPWPNGEEWWKFKKNPLVADQLIDLAKAVALSVRDVQCQYSDLWNQFPPHVKQFLEKYRATLVPVHESPAAIIQMIEQQIEELAKAKELAKELLQNPPSPAPTGNGASTREDDGSSSASDDDDESCDDGGKSCDDKESTESEESDDDEEDEENEVDKVRQEKFLKKYPFQIIQNTNLNLLL
jgi:hypothetical protein